ncbi:HNH endonuclease [Bacillus cereus]|uniref:HNH endonuclease n=1 Tax=Bacillus cereus TaxID=1396 RepID=UPI00214B063D|nr:HNH endonuclease signature motif containing protein [Bacillus cereus]MDA1966212.1 HNH endonuclease signature motif containing protein [Bacillus cereus]
MTKEYKTKQQKRKFYDKYKRDKEAKKFYDSTAWRRCRELALIRDSYRCQECMKHDPLIPVPADMVHHIKERSEYPELALTLDNLISLCNACHNKEHPEKGGGKKKSKRKIQFVKVKANKEFI